MPLAVVLASQDAADRDASDKRPGAFRTISEVSDDLDVPQHVLRFWESKFTQIRPLKRAGGRRYYRPDDIELLRGIRRLLHEQGYTIRGAQRVLKQNGARFVQAVGRGEAEADLPAPEPDAGEASADAPRVVLSQADEAALRAALADLRACRRALAELRTDLSADP